MAFPTSIDSFTTKATNDVVQASHINDPQTAIVNIETKLGIDGSADTNSVDYKLTQRVAGQASSVDGEIALFSGTGGKTIKRANQSGILKASTGVIDVAVADTDYLAPNTVITGATKTKITYDAQGLVTAGTDAAESDITFTDITTNNVSTSKHGYTPKLPNDASKYLDGTGNYTTPATSGLVAFEQHVRIGTSASTLRPGCVSGDPSTAGVFFACYSPDNGDSYVICRYAADTNTGKYYQTHTATLATRVQGGTTGSVGIAVLGSYVYLWYAWNDTGSPSNGLTRWSTTDLSSPQNMTLAGGTYPTASYNRTFGMYADGTYLYVHAGDNNTNWYKYSVSGTTATYSATITSINFQTVPQIGCWSDNTNVYFLAFNASTQVITISKYTVAGSSTSTTSITLPTTDIQYLSSASGPATCGGFFPINATQIYCAGGMRFDSNSAIVGYGYLLFPITKP